MNKPTHQQLLSSDWPMSLATNPNEEDGPYDGSCPCCKIHGQDFEVKVSCWRVTGGASEIFVRGKLSDEILFSIGEHIRSNNGWSETSDWVVEIEKI